MKYCNHVNPRFEIKKNYMNYTTGGARKALSLNLRA